MHRHKRTPSDDGTAEHRDRSTRPVAQDDCGVETTDELSKVLDFIRAELDSLERSGLQYSQKASGAQHTNGARNKLIPTGAVLQACVEGTPKCVFCASTGHSTLDCNAGLSIAEKIKKLSKDMRCFRCTKRGHRSKDCRVNVVCKHCGNRHASVVCDPSKRPGPTSSNDTVTNIMTTTQHRDQRGRAEVLLQTFRLWASSDTACTQLRGIIDGGSQLTFIRDDIAQKLKLKVVGESKLRLNTFASSSTANKTHLGKVVELHLRSQYRPVDYVIRATTIPFICKDLAEIPANQEFVERLRRQGHQIADDSLFPNVQCEAGIGLLIGSDEMWQLLTGEVKRHADDDKTGVCVDPDDVLEKFWKLESIGIADVTTNNNEHDTAVLEEFQRNIRYVDGRYEVALPWKPRTEELEDNFEEANRRLRGLTRRLLQNDCLTKYDEVIRSYLENGHAEKANEDTALTGLHYYMPHRAVVRSESTTTKIRVVFDASSHASGATSLNDHLEKGPKLGADLVPVLLRFRLHRIAITADIRNAFLQIGIREKDRDALRFLWFNHAPTLDDPQPEVECWRMTRVPFGTSASPFLLTATLQHHLRSVEGSNKDLAQALINSFYVDDLLVGVANVLEGKHLVQKAEDIFQRAGMKLSKWASNSAELQTMFLQSDTGGASEGKSFVDTAHTKVLGVMWDRSSDRLSFSAHHLLDVIADMKDSKRSILQASARLFDPLGYLSPYTIRVKMLFQELWKAKIDWDSKLPEEISKTWNLWLKELPDLHMISVERCVLPTEGSLYTYEMHIFTDASPQAYGACALLRSTSEIGETKVSLLFSKSRVAPLQKITLPRLELMGALIGVRIAKFLSQALSLSNLETTFWTDSTITLSWIRGDSTRWKPFVRNRVAEIQANSRQQQWRHCPGCDNPADALTRGLTVRSLSQNTQWFEGPGWLAHPRTVWPKPCGEEDADLESVEEEKLRAALVIAGDLKGPSPLFELSKYSSYNRVVRVTAWIRRFVWNCRTNVKNIGALTASEVAESEMLWVRHVQREVYPEETFALSRNEQIAKSSKLLRLNPFLDENRVMRLTGRLQCSDNTEDIKHPILLPKKHTLSKLIVRNAHELTLHGGVQLTLSTLREKWWIVQARQIVKSIIHDCTVCVRFRATRITAPTAPLPDVRTNPTHPFETTGVDFAGPLYIKASKGYESSSKSYILLFTCATTRSIHLELVTDTTAKAFLMAFRRFISRRGTPSIIYSDNALAFKKASRDIQDLWRIMRSTESQDFMSARRINWRFIVERAAWWGGMWERLIRTVKSCLRRILGRQCLTFEEMETLLHEVEAVVNSRPLTFLHSTPDEPAALTPAHLLIGRTLTALPEKPSHEVQSSTAQSSIRRWRHKQKIADMFWRRWKQEYLLELRSAHQTNATECFPKLSEGDVVLLHDHKTPRHIWKLARVNEVHPGRDGNVRSCTVRLPNETITRRPVQLLYPLEMTRH
ncbi:uncharacterized protein LOC135384870 [Ornithodoros turicata]|uniref:uncharacterized protein LOC135384870 n=1 Tax=Ornithodoros turicata TaxID=34597 RepID=UPI003139CF41